jgi:hypothetical protein
LKINLKNEIGTVEGDLINKMSIAEGDTTKIEIAESSESKL